MHYLPKKREINIDEQKIYYTITIFGLDLLILYHFILYSKRFFSIQKLFSILVDSKCLIVEFHFIL